MPDQEIPQIAVCPDCAATNGSDFGELDATSGLYVCARGHRFHAD